MLHPALRRGQAGLRLRSSPAAGVHGSAIPERRRGTAHIQARILLPRSPGPVFTAWELQQPPPSSLFTARPHGCGSGRVSSCPLRRVNPISIRGGPGGAAGAGRSARERCRRCRSARRTPRGGQRGAERRGPAAPAGSAQAPDWSPARPGAAAQRLPDFPLPPPPGKGIHLTLPCQQHQQSRSTALSSGDHPVQARAQAALPRAGDTGTQRGGGGRAPGRGTPQAP